MASQGRPQTNLPETNRINVVMLRHGQSAWSQRFCGWYDAELTDQGLEEARSAAALLKEQGFQFDVAFTSVLKRARITLDIILKELGQPNVPKTESWKLCERHYGALTGLDKVATAQKYGEKQVQTWRRSYNQPPPPMEKDHLYYSEIRDNPVFADVPEEEFPSVESLESTVKRAVPFWCDTIVPEIKAGRRVLIVAHGTSLRGIVKHLDDVSEEEIRKINIPTAIPFVYTLDGNVKAVRGGSLQYLGDPETVRKAMEEVKNQIKKKTD